MPAEFIKERAKNQQAITSFFGKQPPANAPQPGKNEKEADAEANRVDPCSKATVPRVRDARADRFKSPEQEEASTPKLLFTTPIKPGEASTPRLDAPTPSQYTPGPKRARKRLLSLQTIEKTPGSPRPAPAASSFASTSVLAHTTHTKVEDEKPKVDFVLPVITAGTPLHPEQRSRCPQHYQPRAEEALKTVVTKKFVPAPEIGDPSTINKADYTRAECMTICQQLVDALNRWPNMDDMSFSGPVNNPSPLLQVLFRAIVVHLFPGKLVQMTAPHIIVPEGNASERSETKTVNFKAIDSAALIPPSENIIWYRGQIPFADTMRPKDSIGLLSGDVEDLSDDIREAVERGERYARYIVGEFIRNGSPLVTKKQNSDWLNGTLQLSGDMRNFLGKEGLSHPATLLLASDTVRVNTDIDIRNFFLASADMAWENIVMAAANRAWIESNDIKEAWRALAKSIDQINERIVSGEPSPSACVCWEDQKATTTHACVICGRATICERLGDHIYGGQLANPASPM
ncbi:hypothetical protein F5X68DRAFT_237342 [Plectosphaerella plurivora]|uniref:Uncharacterized protein n=1 Tax=Plectosphaerella plurivora TaxID=936078 RepID=A0A9P8V1H4_9PEZI|nr:hypothetical protein F5X68DRAFT_237342 [Plectosphaerella plurivora]